jgi:hypothetical protein
MKWYTLLQFNVVKCVRQTTTSFGVKLLDVCMYELDMDVR